MSKSKISAIRSKPTKASIAVKLLKRPAGVSLDALMHATGWQKHSVRGFLSGTVGKKLGHAVESSRDSRGIRRYRIDSSKPAATSAS